MGRHSWSNRMTVEGCRVISIADLNRGGIFDKGLGYSWTCSWKNSAGEETASINGLVTEGGGSIRLMYIAVDRSSEDKEVLDYNVEIVTTPCNFGGERRWFVCPLVKDGIHCGRRVGKLYLPPGGKYFGCRRCYNLTYRSCQEHDKRVSALIKNPYLMLGKLQSGDVKDSLLAIRAYFKFLNLGGNKR